MATLSQLSASLTALDLPTPSTPWLNNILSSQRPGTPIKALTATAKHRLLASDITTSFSDPTCSFPSNLSNPAVKELKFSPATDIPVQVLGIEDLSKSRWEQLEAIEAAERGEGTKGREVIRVVAAEVGENGLPVSAGPVAGGGPHKVVLQDWKGQRVFGIELKPVKGVGLGMSIGMKMVLRGTTVARGLILLEPRTTRVLGGKIDVLHKQWLEGRKRELKEAIGDGSD